MPKGLETSLGNQIDSNGQARYFFERQALHEFNEPFYGRIPLSMVFEIKREPLIKIETYKRGFLYGFNLLSATDNRSILTSRPIYPSKSEALEKADAFVCGSRESVKVH